jgi:predicted  nucleic acid-binding Zn-ribbon protein
MWSRRRNHTQTLQEQVSSLRQRIEEVESELVEREAELVDLRVELSAFQLRYDVQVGRKYQELASIESLLGRCKKRIESYRQWGPGGPPRTGDGSGYVSVEEQYRRTWQQPSPPRPSFPPQPLDAITEKEIKKLYRQLCRRFHPDLTQDPEERVWRTEMMAAVNAAYAEQSLTELHALAERPGRPAVAEGGTDQRRLDALRDRLQHVERRIREVEIEIHDLMHSPMMEMSLEIKLAARHGQDLLAEMTVEVEKDLARKRVELDFLQAQLRQLGLEWE